MQSDVNPTRLALALIASYVLVMGMLFREPQGWLHDGKQLLMSDYIAIHAAGLLVADGEPTAAYDWARIKQAHARTLSREESEFFPFPYPPPYLAVAHSLSLLGYIGGALTFAAVTLVLYLGALGSITGSRAGMIYTAASPASLLNVYVLQNGFLTAGLLGGALALIRTRPFAAGMLIGLLAMKPQLGVAVPFALLAGSHWRTILAAAATIAALALLSTAAWGVGPWTAFLGHLGMMFEGARSDPVYVRKLQTLFGLLCSLGVPSGMAVAAQAVLGLASIAFVSAIWRSRASFELKAAALAAGSLLVSPYLFIYDYPILIVAQAFLMRHAALTGWKTGEAAAMVAVNALIFLAAVLPFPPGLVAVLGLATLVWRHLEAEEAWREDRAAWSAALRRRLAWLCGAAAARA